jgi:hypothetical protein
MLQPRRTTCLICDTPLTGRKLLYCSPRCSDKFLNQTRRIKASSERYHADPEFRHRQRVKGRSWCRLPKGFVKPPCQHCGEIVNPRERHHPDYQREDDVIWLCRSCHKKLHAAERRAA